MRKMQWVGLVEVINSQGKGRREMQEGTKKKTWVEREESITSQGKGNAGTRMQ